MESASKYVSAPPDMNSLLAKRKEQGLYRELKTYDGLVDLCSNDYLGLARSEALSKEAYSILSGFELLNGSTGSRLLSGNNKLVMQLEEMIAGYHKAEAALVFNSGYDANIGFFSSIPQEGDTVIYDELIHASIHDGIRLGKTKSFMFRHNDVFHLEERLKVATGNVYVAVESVYSMDGDFSPLEDVAVLCSSYNAKLIVDEAHATGIYGDKGEGLVDELDINKQVFARIHTFGKALGCHGAAVLGSSIVKSFLINYARPFIYSTSLPPHSVASIMAAYRILPVMNKEVGILKGLISIFRNKIEEGSFLSTNSQSPVQCIIVPGNNNVRAFSQHIINSGFDVRPVYSPTVPKGKERVRICLHSFNTVEQLNGLFDSINKFRV